METTELLDRARATFAARAWQDAVDDFEAADLAAPLEPIDLERLATAAYLSGHDATSTDAWSRAHRGWHERGDEELSVRCAFWLGFALMQRGETAQGGGWLARAARSVADHDLDTVERGYLLLPEGLMALDAGEHAVAFERFAEADELARRFDDPNLGALGALGQGQALLLMGRTPEGLRLFDEAMVPVAGGETSPMVAGLVYCAVIEGCHQVFDLGRAREWTAALDRWCRLQSGLVPYRGQCMVHRAQILQVGGDWAEALAEAELARERLSDPPHPAVGMAHYQLGELHRLRGELTKAEAAYRRAHAAGCEPQPGLAMLRLAAGRSADAATAIESRLDGAHDWASRAHLLPAFVEIMLAVGRRVDAELAADELDDIAAARQSTSLTAIAHQTRGALLVARNDPHAALAPLRAALEGWQEVNAPYETAQVRMLLAGACRQLDDRERAALECDVARDVFAQLGAATALGQLDRFVADEPTRSATDRGPVGSGTAITKREGEVLRLVASGHTNREIAVELSISERTVERHLGNIFVKCGVSNRTAATAYAYANGLL